MREDLPRLMAEHQLDALLISGPASHNPAMAYFTGLAHLTRGDLVVRRDGQALLFHGTMERDEAAKSGLPLKNYAAYDMQALQKEAEAALGSQHAKLGAAALRYKAMLADAGVTAGRVALYGVVELNPGYGVFKLLEQLDPGLELVSEPGNPVLLRAMATKSPAEIARIRKVGQITTDIMGLTADFLSFHRAKSGVLVQKDGSPLTIGHVKAKIRLWLAERGLDNPGGPIFAIGRDGAVPHSEGTETDVLALGSPIVFDFFPCELGGGYFYDMTRTWCLGYAPDPVQKLYADVWSVYRGVVDSLQANQPTFQWAEKTCDLFEALGHPTHRSADGLEAGYIHGLGHGVGLHIHEAPWFWTAGKGSESDVLYPGSVVTIEPGLYYPDQGMGCRIEDTYVVHPDGGFEILAPYPYDLVLPVKESRK